MALPTAVRDRPRTAGGGERQLRHVVVADGEGGGFLPRAVPQGHARQPTVRKVQLQAVAVAVAERESRCPADSGNEAVPRGVVADNDDGIVTLHRGAQPRLAAGAVKLNDRRPVRSTANVLRACPAWS